MNWNRVFRRHRIELPLPTFPVVALVLGVLVLIGIALDIGPATSTAEDQGPLQPPSTYASLIHPLLEAKCSECHGEKKQKAGLSLATPERIAAGGRHGPAVDPKAPSSSLMLKRIEFPLDHDKHMPPDDQAQLTSAELAALKAWIEAGAPFQGVVAGVGLEAQDAGPTLAHDREEQAVRMAVAPLAALDALQEALVHVQPISQDSPLLWVDFAAAAKSVDEAEIRALLAPLRAQLCELSLARTAAGDPTLVELSACANLKRLDLRATSVSEAGVAALARHGALAELVLVQTRLADAAVDSLIAMPALARVHLWRSGLSPEAIARLRSARPALIVDDGGTPDSAALEVETAITLTKAPLAAPVVNSSTASPSLVPVNATCPVSGAPVKPQFSVVHEGRVIGFCCPNCPKEFWADPAKFAARLN